jgi:hypothetical protein
VDVRDAIAVELERRLAGADAEGLRHEMSALVRSINGVEAALEAAFDAGVPALQTRLVLALAEFGELSEVVNATLDSLQLGIIELIRGQRVSAEVDERVLHELVRMRQQIRALAPRIEQPEGRGARAGPPHSPCGV